MFRHGVNAKKLNIRAGVRLADPHVAQSLDQIRDLENGKLDPISHQAQIITDFEPLRNSERLRF
jgi:hypothetical protein